MSRLGSWVHNGCFFFIFSCYDKITGNSVCWNVVVHRRQFTLQNFFSSNAASSVCFAAQTLFKLFGRNKKKKKPTNILKHCTGLFVSLPSCCPTPWGMECLFAFSNISFGFKEETYMEFEWKCILTFLLVQIQFSVFRDRFQTSASSVFCCIVFGKLRLAFLCSSWV